MPPFLQIVFWLDIAGIVLLVGSITVQSVRFYRQRHPAAKEQ